MRCPRCHKTVRVVESVNWIICSENERCGWGTQIQNLNREQLKSIGYEVQS